MFARSRYSTPIVSRTRYSNPIVARKRYSTPIVARKRYSTPNIARKRYTIGAYYDRGACTAFFLSEADRQASSTVAHVRSFLPSPKTWLLLTDKSRTGATR